MDSNVAIEPNPCMTAPLQQGFAAALHAAAQPLTLLRARFDAELIALMDEAQLRRSAQRSARHVEHLCSLLRSMQRLLEFDAMPAAVEEIEVSALVESVSEDVERVLEEAGVALQWKIPDGPLLARADGGRLRQVLVDALMLASGASKSAGSIDLVAELTVRGVSIRIGRSDGRCDFQEDRMRLSVAALEANLHSQGGSLDVVANPFSVRIQLACAHQGISRCDS